MRLYKGRCILSAGPQLIVSARRPYVKGVSLSPEDYAIVLVDFGLIIVKSLEMPL